MHLLARQFPDSLNPAPSPCLSAGDRSEGKEKGVPAVEQPLKCHSSFYFLQLSKLRFSSLVSSSVLA